MEALLIIPIFIVLAIVIRLCAGGMDHDRVEQHIAERGGKVLEKSWDPFGKGWYGDKSNRIYQLKYQDADGSIHQATCKTSALSGVYLADDHVVQHSQSDECQQSNSDQIEENRKLKQEIQKLRNKDIS